MESMPSTMNTMVPTHPKNADEMHEELMTLLEGRKLADFTDTETLDLTKHMSNPTRDLYNASHRHMRTEAKDVPTLEQAVVAKQHEMADARAGYRRVQPLKNSSKPTAHFQECTFHKEYDWFQTVLCVFIGGVHSLRKKAERETARENAGGLEKLRA